MVYICIQYFFHHIMIVFVRNYHITVSIVSIFVHEMFSICAPLLFIKTIPCQILWSDKREESQTRLNQFWHEKLSFLKFVSEKVGSKLAGSKSFTVYYLPSLYVYIYIRGCGHQFIIHTRSIKRKMTVEHTYFQSDFFYFSKLQFRCFWRNTKDNKRLPCWNELFCRAFGYYSIHIQAWVCM